VDVVQRSALVIAADPASFERLAGLLRGSRFFADYAETGTAALESIAMLPFDAVVAVHPIADMPTRTFLDAVRGKTSSCRQSAVVLLAPPELCGEAEAFIGRGANRVIAMTDDEMQDLPHVLVRLLEVAPRVALRAVSRLKVQLGNGTRLTLCQTENLSQSGMLIRTDHAYPVGTRMNFELTLPEESKPVRGYAVVVRQTTPERERVSGVGVRISSFEADGKSRYDARLARLAS
jgi:uncharacterized protein (TIGR02266 family)